MQYDCYELNTIDEVVPLLEQLDGFSVTAPYKQSIIPYLDELDATAATIGAVNVVSHRKGYNTDWIGFRQAILPYLTPHDSHAIILGTGGAARAVQFALNDLGITTLMVSRTEGKADVTYADLDEHLMQSHSIIVNCTPLGMHPHTCRMPEINSKLVTSAHILYDCIYNPEETLFIKTGRQAGARIANGLRMFEHQADAAWKIWNN